jgi:hypothetical protein
MKKALTIALMLGLAACASTKKTKSTADALKDLNARWQDKIGVAAKSELVEEFGQADWCEQKPGGAETCRFYHSLGIVWKGDKENRTKYDTFDEIVAEFDPQGVLRDYKARSQR